MQRCIVALIEGLGLGFGLPQTLALKIKLPKHCLNPFLNPFLLKELQMANGSPKS